MKIRTLGVLTSGGTHQGSTPVFEPRYGLRFTMISKSSGSRKVLTA